MTGDISSNTQPIGSNKMKKENIITTDGLEPIIDELTKLQSLTEIGYNVDTMSKFVYEENAKETGTFLQELVHRTDGDIRMHLIIS
jgi:hypothetical protein